MCKSEADAGIKIPEGYNSYSHIPRSSTSLLTHYLAETRAPRNVTGPSTRITANDTQMLTGTQNVLMRNEVTQCLWPVFFNPEIQFSMDYNIYKCKNILLYAQESFHILTQRGRDTKPFKFEYRPGVLNQGWFCPPGNIWRYLETFSVVQLGGGCYWHLVGRHQGCG